MTELGKCLLKESPEPHAIVQIDCSIVGTYQLLHMGSILSLYANIERGEKGSNIKRPPPLCEGR